MRVTTESRDPWTVGRPLDALPLQLAPAVPDRHGDSSTTGTTSTIEGKGVYMGDTLALVNPCPVWWGEGDEKIYVDGEKFPSHFGTGTEDYYGYAWCTPEFFESPFHAQPRAEGPRNQGHVTNTRVRLLDGIPFTKVAALRHGESGTGVRCNDGLRGDDLLVRAARRQGQPRPDARDGPRTSCRSCPSRPRSKGPSRVKTSRSSKKTGGVTEIQESPQLNWSGEKQVWWRDAKPGQRMVFELPVDKAGSYKLTANLTKASTTASCSCRWTASRWAGRSTCSTTGWSTQAYDLGTQKLTAGKHVSRWRSPARTPRRVPRHMFGIDYLKIDPTE